ncbi:MAG: hypothetical protein FH762_02250 [Firmicutes bacterium]|nr:hypothetical protein [Bacillota bacterium]
MTQPINPNTNIPMSLRVEKIQQMKQVQVGQEMHFANQEMEIEEQLKKQRINENEKTAESRIRDKEQEKQGSQDKEAKQEDDHKKKEKQLKKNGDKGSIIDVKV